MSTVPVAHLLFSRRLLPIWLAAGIVAAAIIAACLAQSFAGDGDNPASSPTETAPTPSGSTTVTPTTTAAAPITELRVAYINLASPISTEVNDTSAADTFDDRLAHVIDDLKAFRPDVVGFSEASWT